MKWIDSFLDYLRFERNYSGKTIGSYRVDLLQFAEYVGITDEEPDWKTVGVDAVRSWVCDLMDGRMTTATVNRKLSALRSFYRYLLREKTVEANPLRKVQGPKNKKKLPVFLKENAMDRLLDDVDFGPGFKGVRDRMIIEMFYATGMRLSELLGLKDEDVDFSAMYIKVTGKRNKQRLIPFAEELATSMHEYIQVRDAELAVSAEVFFVGETGKPLSPAVVREIVKRNLSKVTAQRKRSPHVLRHTFATMMLNHDAELGAIKELLGHSSLAATEVYTHATFEELKKMYNQAHPRA